MRKALLFALFALVSSAAYGQQTLTDQINAVDAVQQRREAAKWEAKQAQERHIQEQQKAERARAEKQRAAILADKKRQQDYEDKLRDLSLQQKTLVIDSQKARVARENDFIDQELKERAAKTDVIKSEADTNRNLSEGVKTLLEKKGEAEVKSSEGVKTFLEKTGEAEVNNSEGVITLLKSKDEAEVKKQSGASNKGN